MTDSDFLNELERSLTDWGKIPGWHEVNAGFSTILDMIRKHRYEQNAKETNQETVDQVPEQVREDDR